MDSFNTASELQVGGKTYRYFSLGKLKQQGFDVDRLPYSLRILLENLLRNENGSALRRLTSRRWPLEARKGKVRKRSLSRRRAC